MTSAGVLDNPEYSALKLMKPILPLLRRLLPKMICSLKEVGLAMINATIYGYDKNVIEVTDIVKLSRIISVN